MASICNLFFLTILNCIFNLKCIAGQAVGCAGGFIIGDTGSLQIESSHKPCLWLISLQSKTGLRLTITPRMLKPILIVPQQRVSSFNLNYKWVNGSDTDFYEFEAKSLAVWVPPRRQSSSLSWTGMHADSSQVYFITKLLSESNESVEFKHERDGRYEMFWAFHHTTAGQLRWNLDTVLPACKPKDPCASISFAILEISSGGVVSVTQKTCEGGTMANDIKLTKRTTVLFFLHTNAPKEATTKFLVTWKHTEHFKINIEGLLAVPPLNGLAVIDLNSTIIRPSAFENLNIYSVAFDWNSSLIYCSARGVGIIQANLDGSEPKILLPEFGSTHVRGVAIELTTGNLYYYNKSSRAIRVCNNDAKNCRTIVKIINSSVVYELNILWSKGLLFWLDGAARVFRANLDGSNAQELLKTNRVNGIDLDEDDDRLYWCSDDGIGSCDLNGGDIQMMDNVKNGTSDVAIHGENVYYALWRQSMISVISKHGNKYYPAEYALYEAFFIVKYGKILSSLPPTPCEKLNCAHLCILSLASSYRCVCPDGKKLALDQKSCTG